MLILIKNSDLKKYNVYYFQETMLDNHCVILGEPTVVNVSVLLKFAQVKNIIVETYFHEICLVLTGYEGR